jgi:hypothetical protein
VGLRQASLNLNPRVASGQSPTQSDCTIFIRVIVSVEAHNRLMSGLQLEHVFSRGGEGIVFRWLT